MQNPDYSKKWWIMSSVAMGVFLATIDGSIVNIALPSLVIDLNEPLAVVQWVVLAYLLVVTTLMLGVGRLADMIGRKRLYISGMAIFTLGSLLCGLSPNVYWLIGFRVLQALGASTMQALGTAIVTDAFPAAERGRALGTIGSIVSVGIIAGPTLGGLILGALSWHWLFFVNLPVGILGVILTTRFIPSDHAGVREQFDVRGAAAMFFMLASFLLALTVGQNSSFVNPWVLALFAAAGMGLLAFIRIESRASAPMIDLSLFKSRVLSSNLFTGSLTFIGSAGGVLLIPFYLQNMRGFSPEQAGLMMSAVPVASGVFGPIAGSLSDRFGSRSITAIGLVSQIVGYVLISGVTLSTGVPEYLLRSLPLGIGIGLFQAPNNSAIMGAARRDQLGVVSGMLSLTRTLGQTTGIAILTTVWTGFVQRIAGKIPAGGATFAAVGAQVDGFQKAIWVVIGIVSIALVISVVTSLSPRKQPIQSEA
jgi:EmrB/QacA subfamily drug resistance transporter